MSAQWSTDGTHGAFPREVGAIAFGGGGFKSVGCFWPVLYHLGRTRDLRALLQGNHIGTSSGGGWFFTNLVFNREVWRSVATGRSEEEFLAMFRAFFEDILAQLEARQRPLSMAKRKVLELCLGNSAMKGILEGQGFPLFDKTMIQWIGHYLLQDNGWKLLNDTLSHAQESTPNAGLSLTCDLANGILTKATLACQDNWLRDEIKFYKVQGHEAAAHHQGQIPMTVNARVTPEGTSHTVTICQGAQVLEVQLGSKSTGLGFGRCTCRCGKQADSIEVTKDDLERGCRRALKAPADLAGPTACYFACFNERFFSDYMGISNPVLKNILVELEHKLLYRSFYAVDAVDGAGRQICPLRLVDGGPWDHTGIAMALRGLQREGRSGDLVAITLYSLESYTNFHVMFADFDNKGDHCGIAQRPYPRCFKGSPPTACKAYGEYLQVLDCQVETLDCPEFEIVGGRTYRLFYLFLMPENLMLFPFKRESVEDYISWCAQALKDLELWSAGEAPNL